MTVTEIAGVTLDPPFRASAIVRYGESEEGTLPSERIDFVYDDRNLIWLIDDIVTIP